jgi:hypothetical protein
MNDLWNNNHYPNRRFGSRNLFAFHSKVCYLTLLYFYNHLSDGFTEINQSINQSINI